MTSSQDVLSELETLANSAIAEHALRFFKTSPGEYGAGDQFLGVRVPVLRQLARRHDGLPLRETVRLLRSPWHEARLTALLILTAQYKKETPQGRQRVFDAYMKNVRWVNNWDLVDSSAPLIVGPHVAASDRRLLDRLAKSPIVWERRIAVLATLHFIRQGDFADLLRLAERLLADEHDLIHKAVGWMLREVEKRNRTAAEAFLTRHYQRMPRTMLRYAIERLPQRRRQAYLRGTVKSIS